MAQDIVDFDNHGVRKVGGHTLRMMDVGPDGNPDTADDVLNIGVCQGCHPGLTTFDRNGVRSRNKTKLIILGNLLKQNNHGFLPPFQPGKCSTCHRGGTLPFINDTETKVLEKAYLNYKLILQDRSFGIHNPGYTERLLDDSIAAVQEVTDIDSDGIFDNADNCPNDCNPQQLDADADGIGDVCDTTPGCGGCGQAQCEQACPPVTTTTTSIPDTDSDGILDNVDNCPNNCNTQQLDADNDGIGDVCDSAPGCGGCGQAQCEQEC
jgi:hypothetical protein